MKKLMSMMIMVAMLVTMLSTTAFAVTESKIGFVLNNKVQTWDEKTYGSLFIADGRTFIPLRAVSEKLGYKVTWNAKTNSADIAKGETKISFTIGKKEVTTAKGVVTLDVASFTKNGRTYVPMRGLFEAIGMEVRWLSSKVTAQEIKTSITNMKSDFYVVVSGSGTTTGENTGEVIDENGNVVFKDTVFRTTGGSFKEDFWKDILAKNVPAGVETSIDISTVLVGESSTINLTWAPLAIQQSPRGEEILFVIQGWQKPGTKEVFKAGLEAVAKTSSDGTEIYNAYLNALNGSKVGVDTWAKAKNGTQFYITGEGSGDTIKVKVN